MAVAKPCIKALPYSNINLSERRFGAHIVGFATLLPHSIHGRTAYFTSVRCPLVSIILSELAKQIIAMIVNNAKTAT